MDKHTLLCIYVYFMFVYVYIYIFMDKFYIRRLYKPYSGLMECIVEINTKWFKYDRDDLCVNKSQFVPVIFEPHCK
jgi:hypothetical protein